MKKKLCLLAAVCLLGLSMPVLAADTFDVPLIGRVEVPQNVTIQKGNPSSLSFDSAGNLKQFLARQGATDISTYYLTYAAPPDFTYGWMFSCRLGIPFLQDAGLFDYKDLPVEEQLSAIAEDLNKKLVQQGAYYSGTAPLIQTKKGKNGAYEGYFILTARERDITYHEGYYAVLQSDGYFVNLSVVNLDADQTEVMNSLKNMMIKRKAQKQKKLLDFSDSSTSLTGIY